MNAIIFPGQGSQYTGMGKGLYDNFSVCRDVFNRIDRAVGFNLAHKCFIGSEEELKDTSVQQLAIMAVSLAAYEAARPNLSDVKYFCGLSLGEYSCLYAAGVLTLEDTAILLKERAAAMAAAAAQNPATMMAVIGLDRAVLLEKSKQYGFYLSNINSNQQVVISLKKEIKDSVQNILEASGAKVIELQVSGGFHSPFMQPAKDRLVKMLNSLNFQDAKTPIVSNVTARPHTKASEIRDNLATQLIAPVLLCDCVNFIASEGIKDFYEVGPGKVLKGLIRKINSEIKVTNIEKHEDIVVHN
jgi:[acyl-carrier-protein] S-malonyltransferase